jgi:hypothetical protein
MMRLDLKFAYRQLTGDKIILMNGLALNFRSMKKGINVVTEINKDYPIMLKRELKNPDFVLCR